MRNRIDDPFAVWVEQVMITERDEQPVLADYDLRPADSVGVSV